MRTPRQNKQMVLWGSLGCLALLGALAWYMPASPAGCDRHLDCPPRLGGCYVEPALPEGVCGPRCATDADCPGACCRESALGGALICAPQASCG